MRDFDFHRPSNLGEALAMLGHHGDEACLFAGGTALMLAMRQRLLNPGKVIWLGGLPSLRSIAFDDRQGLRIGALARHADIAAAPEVRARYPVLAAMAAGLAHPQVRNQGTIGGNLCYADPATDPPACLIAHKASVVLAGLGGERVLPIEDFIVDYYTTALAPAEILTEIRLPPPEAKTVGIYTRHLRTAAEHRPVASVALIARRDGMVCTDARLVVGAATATPTRAAQAAAFLEGRDVTLEVAAEAARLVAEGITPISDLRGEADFRRATVRVIAKRAIADAFGLDWKGAAA